MKILKMDRGINHSTLICKLCAEAFTLPEDDDIDTKVPRALFCGHIFCTSCLLSLQCVDVIRCPECEVESAVPEGGVYGLQQDSRIIGLTYTAKMNKNKSERSKNRNWKKLGIPTDTNPNTEKTVQAADIEKIERTVDEALVQATESLAQLEHIHETLTTGLSKQVERERHHLETEIKMAADKASYAVQKWMEVQLNQLAKLDSRFSTSQEQLRCIQDKIKALEIAMQKAREVRRSPFLKQYCILDKVLETLQEPINYQSLNTKCTTLDSGLRCVFHSEGHNESLSLFLKMEVGSPKCLLELLPSHQQVGNTFTNEHADRRDTSSSSANRYRLPSPEKLDQKRPTDKNVAPDVIVEEIVEQQEYVPPPTGPELASDKLRINRKRINRLGSKKNVTMWVVVSNIVSPSHFYVQYVAEKRENEALSNKINRYCSRDGCRFTPRDSVETGSMIFVKWKEGLWCRANVVQVLQSESIEAMKSCPAEQLASIQVFFVDYGVMKTISIQSEEGTSKSQLMAVNNHLRKVEEVVKVQLHNVAPQAIRCCLMDLVPYDLTKGWSKEAQVEFHNLVGSSAVEMRPLGQDRDSLLVDLRKAPMDQSSDMPISVREYLVFIEVARFYSPLTLKRRPLLYYPPVFPKSNTEVNAVVSHINNPADFYIQLIENMESLLLSAKLQDCYNSLRVAGEDDLSIYCPVVGQAYVARYDDKFWYRAQMIGHPGGRKVEVCYVDFGNKNIVPVTDLRKIKDEFFAPPVMAIHCCLSEVVPPDGETWNDACIKRFISLADQKLVTIVAEPSGSHRRPDPLPVKMFESGLNGPLANISELLVKEGLACFREGFKPKDASPSCNESVVWDPPLELGLATGAVDATNQKVTSRQKEQLGEFQPTLKLPAQLMDLKVRISHVSSPSSFFVHLTQYNNHLSRVCELLNQECEFAEAQDVVWKADMYCAAEVNGVWERGQICTDLTSSNIADVIRCDHGNTVKLHVSNLRPLPSFLIGSFALECTLTDIRPAGGRATWTATACDVISCYLTGASAVMTIKEVTDKRPVPVTLCCSNKMGQFVSIADFLVSEGLALRERKPRDALIEKPKEIEAQPPQSEAKANNNERSTHPSNAIPIPSQPSVISTRARPNPAPRTIVSAEKVKTQLYRPPEMPCLGHLRMSVSAIGEDGLIYVRTQNAECQVEQLRERIKQSMRTLPSLKPYTWKSVQGCAVIGPDMLWHRGQLLEVLGQHVKVQYVDYGLVENIPAVHVYPLLLCEDIPQLCVPCKLHGINPIGGNWQWAAVALLKEMLLNRCVDIQVMVLPMDPRAPVTVEVFLDGLSLSKILCHHEHVSLDHSVSFQKVPSIMSSAFLDDWDFDTEGLTGFQKPVLGPFICPNLPQIGDQFQARVQHILTPNELFLRPLDGIAETEVDGETLDDALCRINIDINSLPKFTNFYHDSPCLAEYRDGFYYRAKVIKFINVEPVMILVHHIDFGSDDTLPTSKIRQMPADLLRFPIRALKVRLAGFRAPSVNKQEDVLPYCPEWSVKAVMEMIDMLHTSIKVTVVACEPELIVLLYNKHGELVHLPLVRQGLAEAD